MVPVFGKIQILKRDGKVEPSSNKVLIFSVLVGGCLLLGLYVKQKTNEEEKKIKTGKMKEQNRDTASSCEVDQNLTLISVRESVAEAVNIKKKREEELAKEKEKQREREKEREKENEKQREREKEREKEKQIEREKEEEKKKDRKREKERQNEKEKEKERQKEKENEESPIKIIPAKQFIEEKSLEDRRVGEVTVLSESVEGNRSLPPDSVKLNGEGKRKGREETDIGDILQAQLLDLDDGPEWISKIKTFKITKVRQ